MIDSVRPLAVSPELYEQVCRDYENLKAVNDAVEGNYRRVGLDDRTLGGIDDCLTIEQVAPRAGERRAGAPVVIASSS